MPTTYISDAAHYTKVLSRCEKFVVAVDHLDSVWQGQRCAKCRRKAFCGDRISK